MKRKKEKQRLRAGSSSLVVGWGQIRIWSVIHHSLETFYLSLSFSPLYLPFLFFRILLLLLYTQETDSISIHLFSPPFHWLPPRAFLSSPLLPFPSFPLSCSSYTSVAVTYSWSTFVGWLRVLLVELEAHSHVANPLCPSWKATWDEASGCALVQPSNYRQPVNSTFLHSNSRLHFNHQKCSLLSQSSGQVLRVVTHPGSSSSDSESPSTFSYPPFQTNVFASSFLLENKKND